ncbi:MAG: YggT family protein [Chloroflexi bacterium]|nr:YggT family protein [Chloroflexota bacterium]
MILGDPRDLVQLVGTFFYIAIFARVLLSWFPNVPPSNPVVRLLYSVTEPILRPIRRVLPKFGMMDLSPMVAVLLVVVVQEIFLAVLPS